MEGIKALADELLNINLWAEREGKPAIEWPDTDKH